MIKKKGFPLTDKKYKTSHEEADIAEKKKYPKGYKELKNIDEKISKNQLIGKNTKTGKIEVSKKVPKKLRNEVAFHEKVENKNINRLKKK